MPTCNSEKDGKQLLSISYYNFGAPQTALINFKGNSYKKEIEFGQNNIEIPIEPVLTNETLPMEIALSDKVYKKDVKLIPARKWEANFMQITHTDIGYTRPQTDILAEHVRFLDYVLTIAMQQIVILMQLSSVGLVKEHGLLRSSCVHVPNLRLTDL